MHKNEQEVEEIRAWLIDQKGTWAAITKKSGLTARTLTNLVNNPDQVPRRRTISQLKKAMKALSK